MRILLLGFAFLALANCDPAQNNQYQEYVNSVNPVEASEREAQVGEDFYSAPAPPIYTGGNDPGVYVGDGGWQEEAWPVQGGYSDDQFYPAAPSGNPFGIPDVIFKGLTFILVFFAFKEMYALGTNIWGLKKTFWDDIKGRSLDPETTEQIMTMIDQGALKFADWIKQE